MPIPKFKIQNPNWPTGFTLIELTVVVSLITLMLFLAIPRFETTLFSDNTNKTSRWIVLKTKALRENAVRDHKRYILQADMSANSLRALDETMTEDMLQNGPQNVFEFPVDIKLVDVEYPVKGKISSGRIDISFYKNGYSDKAIIHIEDEDHHQLSFLLEPFLPYTKLFKEYISFEE